MVQSSRWDGAIFLIIQALRAWLLSCSSGTKDTRAPRLYLSCRCPGLLFLLGDPIDGELHHFLRILETKLLFDVSPVRLDRFDAKMERFGD
jgi:hypothetical protein